MADSLSKPPAAPLARRVMSTDEVPAAQRLAYWLDVVCKVYCGLDCEPPRDREIFGRVEFSGIGELTFTSVESNGRGIVRTPERIRAGNEDHFLVLLPRRGAAVLRQSAREAVLHPGDFAFHDCALPFELAFEEAGHAAYALRLKRSRLEAHVRNLDDLTAVAVAGRGAAGQLLVSMVQTLHRDLDSLHPSSALGVCEGITSIVAAGLRSLPRANLRASTKLAAYHLTRIKAHVREHLCDPALSAASAAAAVGLSPAQVSRLFRGEPAPLSRFIWQQRLEACRRDLADPRLAHRSVSDIAFSWGFNDAAHFSRVFRLQHGMSPREWRQR